MSDEELLALKPRSETRLLGLQVDAASLAACLEAFYGYYEALHDTLFEGVYDGVRGMLDAIRAAGCRTGIVTGKSRRAWEITVARAPLGAFDVLVFDDDVDAPKPDPCGIRLAVQGLGVSPQRALYVGDSIGDVRAASAAGVTPGAILWSKRDDECAGFADRAEAEGATIFATPAALTRAVAPASP